MKTILPIITLAVILFSCCTKKFCTGEYYKDIRIAFQGYSGTELEQITITEYDKASGQAIGPARVSHIGVQSGSPLLLGNAYTYGRDSFYLDQRYFIISRPNGSDTIKDISYQTVHHTINCNNCFGQRDMITDISNFSYTCRGRVYHESDTLLFVK
ncbi:MAG: hypothetical protein JST90_19135 [Bacteroidetes bacterium]|nr:hypothetical protein [Bacteroidota bacterium]